MARATKASRRRGSLIIISAPSGAGKSTLVKRLLATVRGLRFSVSYTTRTRRRSERHGRAYFFVSRERFEEMIRKKEFVEWANVHGHLYGTAWNQLRAAQHAGRDLLLDIDVQGHRQVRERLPEAVSIFVLPPSFRELARRLRRRHSDAPAVIERRLNTARQEMAHWPEYDYLVVNDRLPAATRALGAVVGAARHRRSVQQKLAQEISKTFGG